MKKLLFVITQGEWGGAQRYVCDLATNLAEEFDVTVAMGEPEGRNELQKRLMDITNNLERLTRPIEVISLKHLVRRISPYHDLLAIFELARLYKKLKPDIIHLNSSKASIIGSLATEILALDFRHLTTVIYTVHGWVFNEPLSWFHKKLYHFLEKLTARWKDGLILLSEAERRQGAWELGIAERKMTVIPHGVARSELMLTKNEARAELERLSEQNLTAKKIVGAIANYYPPKGLDVLIDAVALKKNELEKTCFFLIGDGPERENLTAKIISHKLTNVFLTGTLPNAARLLPAFDLFVLPSRKEGLPYSLLEALAAGVPVVATNVGGVPSIIKNNSMGRLAPPENPPALGDAILSALKNPNQFKLTPAGYSLPDEIAATKAWYCSLLP